MIFLAIALISMIGFLILAIWLAVAANTPQVKNKLLKSLRTEAVYRSIPLLHLHYHNE